MILSHLKADMVQIKREPIMLLFALLSLFLIGIMKGLYVYGGPVILDYVGIDLTSYEAYVMGMVLLMQTLMLGTVMGFFMLDEKDAGIMQLLSVTPLGISGYLMNRLLLPLLLTVLYSFTTMTVFTGTYIPLPNRLLLLIFLMTQTAIVGMFIALVSGDKVKGLTNAKAVSALTIAGFADLFSWQGMEIIGRIMPQYYVTKMITGASVYEISLGFAVHGLWLYVIIRKTLNKL